MLGIFVLGPNITNPNIPIALNEIILPFKLWVALHL